MEFPSIGKQCKKIDCQELDFLPIVCSYCKESFCKEHFQPTDHSCSPYSLLSSSVTPHATPESYTCSFLTCSQKELVRMPCLYCELHFCLQHRHQVDHNCMKLVKPEERMKETAAIVKEIVNKNAEKRPIRQGAKSEKLAAKVQLMKLKQNSKGITELPAEERVYFLVKLPTQSKDISVYVSKLWSIGKCIDYIASVASVPNHNNILGRPHLNIFSIAGDLLSEKKDTLLKDIIEQELIFNGQSIALKYV